MSKSVHHYGYLKQNQGMNTKSQLVVQCYQLAFLLKSLLKKTKSKNHVLKSNNKVLAFNIKLNLQQQLRF